MLTSCYNINSLLLSDSTCGKIVGQIAGQKLRTKNKLTSLAIKKLKTPGRYYLVTINQCLLVKGAVTLVFDLISLNNI